jgi:hypothetical protein
VRLDKANRRAIAIEKVHPVTHHESDQTSQIMCMGQIDGLRSISDLERLELNEHTCLVEFLNPASSDPRYRSSRCSESGDKKRSVGPNHLSARIVSRSMKEMKIYERSKFRRTPRLLEC